MSMESALKFMERVKTDQEFAQLVSEIKDAEARMAFAREAGFDFSPQEMQEALKGLSDDELNQVSGGLIRIDDCNPKFANGFQMN